MTYSAAGNAGGDGPAAAVFVSRFTTFTYSEVLLGPALIRAAAQLIGLSWTLAVLLPVLVLLAAVSLPGSRERRGTIGGEAIACKPDDAGSEVVAA
jgi:hypothetical protein